ncbi:SDR family oxidoreductase [Streptomyces paromomycinus]|uniref:Beta-ketoacyl-ACP reductase n=1 Tax=Streptomyces paromomycinus TaxID=92743 RepID=A0A401VXK6_STREY|nr:SDR family oxidoreductase [Streptomyces paromomycinus]GCD41810.1 beta-ketoacyl-ACP reductase [Streptomyces paromomycinus]
MSRSVLVTDGNLGVGHAVARLFAQAGDKVAILYSVGEPPADLLQLGCLPIRCGTTDTEEVGLAFKQAEAAHGPVEVLISHADLDGDQVLNRIDEADFAGTVDTALTGTFRMVKRAVRSMLPAHRGRIVLIASSGALTGGCRPDYAAAKAGLIGFARSLTRELGQRSITVNVVSPGLTEDGLDYLTKTHNELSKAAFWEEIRMDIPLGRPGLCAEVAAAVQFLASAEASYISGAVLPVDGGAGAGH